jgi:hypothetical protein
VTRVLRRCAAEGDVPRWVGRSSRWTICSDIAVNVVHVVRNPVTSAPPKYHAPLTTMVTCGQSWIIKIGKLAASM